MVKALSFLVIGFILSITIPICIGIAGGIFGLTVGLIGGIVGIVIGIIGALIGGIAWIFKSLFHLLFGWHHGLGFHWFHFNGYILAALVVLILAISLGRKK